MSTVLLSDAHLQGPHDPTQRDFIDFVGRGDFDELVIVGDLFDLWLVPPRCLPTAAVPVIEALHTLVRQGKEVTWLGGNHDPLPRLEHLGIHGGRSWRGRAGARRLVAVHGDRGTDPTWLHRLGQRSLRSRLTSQCVRLVGVDRVWTLGRAVSTGMRRRHTDEGLQLVLRRQSQLADRLLRSADVVLLGHSHAPGVEERPGGRLINLGDWYQHRTFVRIDAGAIRLLHWTGTEEQLVQEGPPQRRRELLG